MNDTKLQRNEGLKRKPISSQTHPVIPIHIPQYQEFEEDEVEPPIISFKITTISNSRIDKVVDQVDYVHEEKKAILHQPKRGLPMTSTRPLKFLGLSTAEDETEFSYDYETYMYQVTSVDKQCIGSPQDAEQLQEQNMTCCPPASPKHCFFGLELLDLSDTVVVKQCHSLPSVIKDVFQKDGTFPTGSPFEISTKTGSPIFFMAETTNCVNRLLSCGWIGLTRSFTAKIVDVCGRHTMDVSNVGMNCCCCCKCCLTGICCCCLSSNRDFRVTLADGEFMGSVGQTRGDHCNPGFVLKDTDGNKIVRASGPKCSICEKMSFLLSTLCCCFSCLIDDDVFYFAEKRGKQIARVKKSKVRIFGSDNDLDIDEHQVIIDFAAELDVRMKSLVLSASFVIDFLYWQSE